MSDRPPLDEVRLLRQALGHERASRHLARVEAIQASARIAAEAGFDAIADRILRQDAGDPGAARDDPLARAARAHLDAWRMYFAGAGGKPDALWGSFAALGEALALADGHPAGDPAA